MQARKLQAESAAAATATASLCQLESPAAAASPAAEKQKQGAASRGHQKCRQIAGDGRDLGEILPPRPAIHRIDELGQRAVLGQLVY